MTKTINIRSKEEIKKIHEAGLLVAEFLETVKPFIKPGIRTIDIDNLAGEFVNKYKVIATFKEVPNYFHNTCISINEQIVHGIPGDRVVMEGDLVKVDFGIRKNGYIGDACKSYTVGKVPERITELVRVTEEALYKGIEKAIIGNKIGDLGYAIQRHVEKHRFSVVREYVGHGVGTDLHEPPSVPHFGQRNTGIELKAGMVIAIEPMINVGTWRSKVQSDGWTVVTQDGKWSAQYEHTIAITENGPQILTSIK